MPCAAARLCVILSFGISVCCAACGQTGSLTLGRPVDSPPESGPAAPEPDERDEAASADTGEESEEC
ncbi:hypothetical protein [Candidatus Rariloculus sp.]|uniref:hypothetical protein n=1 Tax=Candidatus Rariloculus sp. TaxID=3101265 RepID=UPI003D0EE1A7